MKTTGKPYHDLKTMEFSEAEIAPWVKRPGAASRTPDARQKTGSPPTIEPEMSQKQPPMGSVSTGIQNRLGVVGDGQIGSQVLQDASRRGYRGYTSGQLKGMNLTDLAQLGLVKAHDVGAYMLGHGEYGRMILDQLLETPLF